MFPQSYIYNYKFITEKVGGLGNGQGNVVQLHDDIFLT